MRSIYARSGVGSTKSSFRMPKVKVCGLTRSCDAKWAQRMGADALGVVHAPGSVRHVPWHEIARVFAGCVAPAKILVAIDPQPRCALSWMLRSGVNAIQLCGQESPQDWEGFPFAVLRRVGVDEQGEHEMRRWAKVARGFVLEHPGHAGGSGQLVNFAKARELASKAPCLLAGGLGPDNVHDAIATVRPLGVDASSRLEQSPGRKHSARVQSFVKRARRSLGRIRSQ